MQHRGRQRRAVGEQEPPGIQQKHQQRRRWPGCEHPLRGGPPPLSPRGKQLRWGPCRVWRLLRLTKCASHAMHQTPHHFPTLSLWHLRWRFASREILCNEPEAELIVHRVSQAAPFTKLELIASTLQGRSHAGRSTSDGVGRGRAGCYRSTEGSHAGRSTPDGDSTLCDAGTSSSSWGISVALSEEAIRPAFLPRSSSLALDSPTAETVAPECQGVSCVIGHFGGVVGCTLAGAPCPTIWGLKGFKPAPRLRLAARSLLRECYSHCCRSGFSSGRLIASWEVRLPCKQILRLIRRLLGL